jgi:NADH dehydrogenase FAD-containing subunit
MKKVVLIGGGHSHLYCLKKFIEESPKDINLVLISPSPYQYYSGMFSGYTEGFYSLDDIRIDLRLINPRITFVEDTVVKVDPIKKLVISEKGKCISFDVLSFDIGSLSEELPFSTENIFPIKPNYLFATSIYSFREQKNPIIVGGGASGIELAFAVQAYQKKSKIPQSNVTLVSSSRILPSLPTHISKVAKKIAFQNGIQLVQNEYITQVSTNELKTQSGKKLSHNGVLWLTGPKASDLFMQSNLLSDQKGFLFVNDYLQHIQYPFLFGAGDCVTLKSTPNLPKNGVYAVRQGHILWDNIRLFLSNNPLNKFKPQKNFLSIIATGNKRGLLVYGKLYAHNKLSWSLKSKIDKQFMQQYQ